MKKICLIGFLIILSGLLLAQSEVFSEYEIRDQFVKSGVASDLDFIMESIEKVHPNPYHDNSRENILIRMDSLVSVLPDTVSKNKAYLAFKHLTAAYREGHTDVMLFVTQKDLPDYQHAFPLWVNDWNDAGFIVQATAVDNADIRPGDVIVSINGLTASDMKKEIARYSGESDTYALSNAVGLLFPLWVELLDIYEPFHIQYLKDGQRKTAIMNGISAIRYNSLYNKFINTAQEPFEFIILEDNIGYIAFHSFSYPKAFKKFLKKSFSRMKKENCRGLIIDLRNNAGGMADLNEMLIDYIREEPYTKIYIRDTKISQYHKDFQLQLAQHYKARGFDLEGREQYLKAPNNTIYRERDTNIIIPGKNKRRFTGPLCFLIGPKCFSSAQAFMELIKQQKIGTLIGEPLEVKPGGYADLCFFVLPNTKFKFSTSTAHFLPVTENDSTPVQPDILVEQTATDAKENRDTVLEFAKKWIREQ